CVTVGMGEEPAEARPADAAAALALCEALLDAQRPDFAYVRLDAPVDADTLETWLRRIDAKLGSSGACYVCVGETPPGDDAVAALFTPKEAGLSEEDAAALRDRLMGLGYL
ncbi:MAG TPA: hypothetical protein PKL84_09670, partial [Candidatus Hydrogenedentes bacterium]|nr:hypothetical protein [Candidatus Hydrogenedentota bacterium]